LICTENMQEWAVEARALARLLAEFPQHSAWFSFSARDGAHTSQGEPIAACAAWLDAVPQVAAIGVNCTAPHFIPDLVSAIASATGKPIVVYPNSGETYRPASNSWGGAGETQGYAEQAAEWYARGARLIGGCCRTSPREIRAVAEWARAR
ncbi:homocysteine methyltransferase, partial [Kouleothrix aurantiaca]